MKNATQLHETQLRNGILPELNGTYGTATPGIKGKSKGKGKGDGKKGDGRGRSETRRSQSQGRRSQSQPRKPRSQSQGAGRGVNSGKGSGDKSDKVCWFSLTGLVSEGHATSPIRESMLSKEGHAGCH